jgi:hypothetical protein
MPLIHLLKKTGRKTSDRGTQTHAPDFPSGTYMNLLSRQASSTK